MYFIYRRAVAGSSSLILFFSVASFISRETPSWIPDRFECVEQKAAPQFLPWNGSSP